MNMACGADEVEHERLMPSGFYELAAHQQFPLFAQVGPRPSKTVVLPKRPEKVFVNFCSLSGRLQGQALRLEPL